MGRVGIALLAAGCCLACALGSRQAVERPGAAPDAALVYVFLDVPEDPSLSSLQLDGAALSGVDGAESPLAVLSRTAGRGKAGEQRLVAVGGAAPGRYDAIVFRTAQPGGGTAEELRAPLALTLSSRQGLVIDARLRVFPGSTADGATTTGLEAEVAPYPTFGAMGLVSSATDDAVVILDKRTGRVGALVRTGRSPAGIAIDAVRRRGYVVSSKDDTVSSLDLDQAVVTASRALQMGDEPVAVELLPDRTSLVVVNRGSGSVSFVEPEGLAETDRLPIGGAPTDVAIERAGQRAYVFNALGSTVTVIDVRARKLAGVVAVESGPVRGYFNRAQDRLWVLHDGSPSLSCIDTRTLSVVQRVDLGAGGTALRVDPATDKLYVSRRDGGGIDVYDSRLLLPIETLPSGGRADYLGIDAETRILGAALSDENRVEGIGTVRKSRVWAADVRGAAYVRFVGER